MAEVKLERRLLFYFVLVDFKKVFNYFLVLVFNFYINITD